MDIKDEFNKIALEYDARRRKFIPCFDAFYDEATSFIASVIKAPRRVLDLGAGTGLLTHYWMKRFPNAAYTLVDVASNMLDEARRRFGENGNVSYVQADYANDFPKSVFDVIISALSIHHLEDALKKRLFSSIYDALPAGGVFVNYDQFCADSKKADAWITSFWKSSVVHSGLSDADISRWRERQKLDRECSVQKEIDMLSGGAHFDTAECIYKNGKFAVIIAVKE